MVLRFFGYIVFVLFLIRECSVWECLVVDFYLVFIREYPVVTVFYLFFSIGNDLLATTLHYSIGVETF